LALHAGVLAGLDVPAGHPLRLPHGRGINEVGNPDGMLVRPLDEGVGGTGEQQGE